MSERTSYTPGTPCWVELSGTPDVEASESFYRELFGWEMPELPNSAELGEEMPHGREDQVVLGAEVVVGERRGHAGARGDLRYRHVERAARGDLLQRRADQGAAANLGQGGARAHHGLDFVD